MTGRPSLYKPEYVEQAYKLCLLGATDKDMADFFGVAVRTINLWKENHAEFMQSLKKGKMMADADVAESLYKRARGFYVTETFKGQDGEPHEATRYYPPDPTSMIYWLKNRQPEKWRDKHEVEHGTNKETADVVKGFLNGKANEGE